MRILVDTRDPWQHPWAAHFSPDTTVERGTLETGDVALAAIPEGVVIERKTVSDFLGCVGSNRERFERELRGGRHCGRFVVIVEGALVEVLHSRRAMSEAPILGTIAAWTARYCPIVFAGRAATAAALAESCLRSQIRVPRRTGDVLTEDAEVDPPRKESISLRTSGVRRQSPRSF